jgi:hypothetical protein
MCGADIRDIALSRQILAGELETLKEGTSLGVERVGASAPDVVFFVD